MIDEKDKGIIMQVLEALIQAMDGRDSNKLDDMGMDTEKLSPDDGTPEHENAELPEIEKNEDLTGKEPLSEDPMHEGMEPTEMEVKEKPAGAEQMPEGFAQMIARKKKEKEYA